MNCSHLRILRNVFNHEPAICTKNKLEVDLGFSEISRNATVLGELQSANEKICNFQPLDNSPSLLRLKKTLPIWICIGYLVLFIFRLRRSSANLPYINNFFAFMLVFRCCYELVSWSLCSRINNLLQFDFFDNFKQ